MGKCLKNVKIVGFFDIFFDILHKMKENLSQEHVERGLYPKVSSLSFGIIVLGFYEEFKLVAFFFF